MDDDASKPKRKRAQRRGKARPKRSLTDSGFAAQVLADAAEFGDEAAAEKHNVSTRSIRRYRARAESGDCPELAASVQAKRAAVAAQRAAATLELLDFLEAKMREAATVAAGLGKLFEVAGAYKIVTDRISADRMTELTLGGDEEQPKPAAAAPSPGLRVVNGGR